MLLEVPQIIVQQRVDQTYDGGQPVWGQPAVVYASGPVASIGVIVIGIRKCACSLEIHKKDVNQGRKNKDVEVIIDQNKQE